MQLDARKLKDGVILETDVCIVGSGPAGLTLAQALMTNGREVTLLESGGRRLGRSAQELNEGEVVGDPYSGLRDTRHRQVGGAPNIWNTPFKKGLGAKFVPLDRWDFQERHGFPLSGWPFDFAHLEPFYARAQEVCGLGPFAYEASPWTTPERPGLSLEPDLEPAVYQFGPRNRITRDLVKQLEKSPQVRFYNHATVSDLRVGDKGREVVEVTGLSSPDRGFRVRASTFVLAAGAIENARLLLLSGGGEESGLGNAHGWVGRCFMEHPRDYALTLIPQSPRFFSDANFYDAHEAADGTVIGGRIGLGERAVVSEGLPNASVTLLPRVRRRTSLVEWAARMWLCPHSSGSKGFRGGYGWSKMNSPARWLDGFRLVVNTEQRPHPENRIILSRKKDPLGLPQAELHWRWRDEEQANLERLRTSLAIWLERSGLGRVQVEKGQRPDPNACHHAGTTRMADDAGRGVVDGDGRVHGTENLFVTGASVFPTCGYANPTLTIVALALRLADHLQSTKEG